MTDICSIRRAGFGWSCRRCGAGWVGDEPRPVCLRQDVTDEEIEAAARSDPDNPPLAESDFKRMRLRNEDPTR